MTSSALSIVISLLFVLIVQIETQQYSFCGGQAPLSIGNLTNQYYANILEISEFMNFDVQVIELAFQNYLNKGSSAQLDQYMVKEKNFYIVLVALIAFISLTMLIILIKMGDIKLTTIEIFLKIKEKGYTSPLSGLFTLMALALLISVTSSVYLMFSMIKHLDLTSCRINSVGQVTTYGSLVYGWSGMQKFSKKLKLLRQFSNEFGSSSIADQTIYIKTCMTHFKQLVKKYNGMIQQYQKAIILVDLSNSSRNVELVTFIPYLFINNTNNKETSIFNQLQRYIQRLYNAINDFQLLQYHLKQGYNQSANIQYTSDLSYRLFKQFQIEINIHFNKLNSHFVNFFDSTKFVLIVCQIISGIAIIACLISLVSIRLIQYKYDFFSLKGYKIIWVSHIVSFCLNMIFLMIFNDIFVYSQGLCSMTSRLFKNQTIFQDLMPSSKSLSDLYIIKQCLYKENNDLINISKTNYQFQGSQPIFYGKKLLQKDYTIGKIANYDKIIFNIKEEVSFYAYGNKGQYKFQNVQLNLINDIVSNNPFHQYCFKHRWVYSHKLCPNNQQVIILPKSSDIPFLSAMNYSSAKALCLVLNSYPSANQRYMTYLQFIKLYNPFKTHCNQSITKLQTHGHNFFNAQTMKQNVIDNLVKELQILKPQLRYIQNHLASYIDIRLAFFRSLFQRLSPQSTYQYIFQGNNCEIIKNMINGANNQFCINFRASSRIVYLLIFCNFGYSIMLVILSFFYAYELHTINRSIEEQQATQRAPSQSLTHHQSISSSSSSSKSLP